MKKALLLISSLGIIVQFFAGCTGKKQDAKSMEQLYKENGVPVKVKTVVDRPFTTEHVFHAVLTGIKESTAGAAVADKVEKIHFKVGDRVEKDQVVISFPIDNPAAQYNQAKVAFEHAKSTLQRMKNLYENGGISLQEYENTKTQFQVTKANWQAVQQSVKVKAPISGIITQIDVQESDNVRREDKLFTVSQTHRLKARL